MSHPCELFADNLLDALSAHAGKGELRNKKALVPSVFPSWDPRNGKVGLEYWKDPGNLLCLRGQVSGKPRWLTLQFGLGDGVFSPGDVIGLTVSISCNAAHDFRPFIRTRTGSGDRDTPLAQSLPLSPGQPLATALHTVDGTEKPLCIKQSHKLCLRLPLRDFELSINGLQFFVQSGQTMEAVPAAAIAR